MAMVNETNVSHFKCPVKSINIFGFCILAKSAHFPRLEGRYVAWKLNVTVWY